MNKSNDKRYHRANGPAFVDKDIKHWWLFGKIHRYYGPARIRSYGNDWVVNGIWIKIEN